MRRSFILLGLLLGLVAADGPAQAAPLVGHRAPVLGASPCAGKTVSLSFTANDGKGLFCVSGERTALLEDGPGVTFSRASPKSCLTSSGVVVYAAANVPCITDQGWLVEGSSTNSLLHSSSFSSGWYLGTGGSVSPNSVVAPDGTMTASAYTWPSALGQFAALEQTINGDASEAQTYSVWLKVPSGTKTLKLGVGNINIGSSFGSLATLTTIWQRFSFSLPASTLGNTGQIGVGMDASGASPPNAGDIIDVWNEQLELGAFSSSSDIFTTTTAVTRAADSLLIHYTQPATTAIVIYGSSQTTSLSPSSPTNLGSSSGGTWIGSYVQNVVVK